MRLQIAAALAAFTTQYFTLCCTTFHSSFLLNYFHIPHSGLALYTHRLRSGVFDF